MLRTLEQRPDQNHQLEAAEFRLYFAVQVLRGSVRISCYEHLDVHATCLSASAVRLAVCMLALVYKQRM
jgi:hypothetical protein